MLKKCSICIGPKLLKKMINKKDIKSSHPSFFFIKKPGVCLWHLWSLLLNQHSCGLRCSAEQRLWCKFFREQIRGGMHWDPTSQAIVWFCCRGERERERQRDKERNKRNPSVVGQLTLLFNAQKRSEQIIVIINTTHCKTVLGICIHTALLEDLKLCCSDVSGRIYAAHGYCMVCLFPRRWCRQREKKAFLIIYLA